VRKRIRIDYEPPFLANKIAHKSRRFLAKPEPRTYDSHVGKRNVAAKIGYSRLGQERTCGRSRLLRHDETDEPRASGARAEASYHRRVREAVRAADDRDRADGTLVRVARTRTKAACYLLWHFH
jgi:hypothetical protein